MKIKTKKVVKKTAPSESSETGKMMVLLEDMRDGIKLVAEGHSILERKIDSLEDKMDEKFEGVDRKFEKIDQKFKGIDENFKTVFEHFSNIEDEILEIKTEIKNIRGELCNKADFNRLAMLEERVAAIEARQMFLRDEGKKKYES